MQWKGRRCHPYGWWFGTVQSVRGNRVVLLFRCASRVVFATQGRRVWDGRACQVLEACSAALGRCGGAWIFRSAPRFAACSDRTCRQYPRSSVWHRVRAPIKPGAEAAVNGDWSFG